MAPWTLSWATALLAVAAVPAVAQQKCNGQLGYCDRIWSDLTQVGSHDSPFVGDLPTQNQHSSVEDQLGLGMRFLQAQTHKNVAGTLDVCHTSCWLEDAGSVSDYLGKIKSFLDGNPDEVIGLLLTNGDNVDPGMFNDAFKAAGLDGYAFVPPNSPAVLAIGDWPKLSDMISSGKRLVFFLDYGADTGTYPYMLDEFSYFWETHYDVTDASFSDCSIDRPSGASDEGRMYIINHFLDVKIGDVSVPDAEHAEHTNQAQGDGSIGANVDNCVASYNHKPKVILLDYVDKGQAILAEQQLNGVAAARVRQRNKRHL